MNINWFFYNYSNSTGGIHIPIIQSTNTVLDENEETVTTIDKMLPKKLSSSDISINQYQWLPIVGGNSFTGCYLINECFVNGKWLKNENGIINLDNLKSIKNTGMPLPTLADKIFLLSEWSNFGILPYRVSLYIPNGNSVSNFFFGLIKTNL